MTSVWVGFDQPRSMGNAESGARAALPIWVDYMALATNGQPGTSLPKPDAVVDRFVNKDTGKITSEFDPRAYSEVFAATTAPEAVSTIAAQPGPTPYVAPTTDSQDSQDDLF